MNITDVADDASEEIKKEAGPRLVSMAGFSLTHDTRNSTLLPDKGQKTELLAELAGGPLGAETDFYRTIRSLLKERQNSEFDQAVRSVKETLEILKAGAPPAKTEDHGEWQFVLERVQALQDFFDALDSLTRAITRLESLGYKNIQKILKVLK